MKRFWGKVDIQGKADCWPWLVSHNGKGYGYFGFKGSVKLSHRVAWELIKEVSPGK